MQKEKNKYKEMELLKPYKSKYDNAEPIKKLRAKDIITKAVAKTKNKRPPLEDIGDRYIRSREGMY